MLVVHTGRTKRQLVEYLLQHGVLDLVATRGSVTRRLRAYLDELKNLYLVDPDTGTYFPSISNHRGHVFLPPGWNTYDFYCDLNGLSLRTLLQLSPGAPR